MSKIIKTSYHLNKSEFAGGLAAAGKTDRFHSSSNDKSKQEKFVRKLDELNNPSPVTNPANFPPFTPTPAIVTVPASNPTPVNPFPTPTPTTIVPSTTTPTQPITNPVNPGNTPVINPVNQPTNAPITPGQTWCIAKTGAPETALQDALNYACGIGGADCSTIQEGGSCYNPNSLENHASVAFNSYFQKNPSPTSCDFGGTAVLVNTNPSKFFFFFFFFEMIQKVYIIVRKIPIPHRRVIEMLTNI